MIYCNQTFDNFRELRENGGYGSHGQGQRPGQGHGQGHGQGQGQRQGNRPSQHHQESSEWEEDSQKPAYNPR